MFSIRQTSVALPAVNLGLPGIFIAVWIEDVSRSLEREEEVDVIRLERFLYNVNILVYKGYRSWCRSKSGCQRRAFRRSTGG